MQNCILKRDLATDCMVPFLYATFSHIILILHYRIFICTKCIYLHIFAYILHVFTYSCIYFACIYIFMHINKSHINTMFAYN